MAELATDIHPAEWQITATTCKCDLVNEYVTIAVNGDWSCKCMWWNKHKSTSENPKHKFSKEIVAKISKCQGPSCKYALDYRDKLIKEEPMQNQK
jgi:hypothetical protein